MPRATIERPGPEERRTVEIYARFVRLFDTKLKERLAQQDGPMEPSRRPQNGVRDEADG